MKSAQSSAEKFVQRASAASQDYVEGSQSTTKDQAALAIAGKANWATGVQAAIAGDRFAKGLSKSGKSGWLTGVQEKGSQRFAGGVAAASNKYATNSGKFDGARNAAAALPRGPRGSAQNLNRVAAVANALNKMRVGGTN